MPWPRSRRPLRARTRSTMNARSNAALYAAGTHPESAAAISCATAAKRGESFTSSSLMPWMALTSAGIGDPGIQEPVVAGGDQTVPCDHDPHLHDAVDRRIAPGGLNVDQGDGNVVPRHVLQRTPRPAHAPRSATGARCQDRAGPSGNSRTRRRRPTSSRVPLHLLTSSRSSAPRRTGWGRRSSSARPPLGAPCSPSRPDPGADRTRDR